MQGKGLPHLDCISKLNYDLASVDCVHDNSKAEVQPLLSEIMRLLASFYYVHHVGKLSVLHCTEITHCPEDTKIETMYLFSQQQKEIRPTCPHLLYRIDGFSEAYPQ